MHQAEYIAAEKPPHPPLHIAPSVPCSLEGNRLCLMLACAVGLTALAFIALCLNRGLDLSDESTYLIHMGTPFAPLAKTSDYGTLLHLPYMWLGQSIYAMRVAGFCALLVAALFLGGSVLRLARQHFRLTVDESLPLLLMPVFGVAGYYCIWRPTPCYDTLALLGLMGGLGFLAQYQAHLRNAHASLWITKILLVGLAAAGVLTCLGKATTAAGLALMATVWIAGAGHAQRGWRGVGADLAFAALMALLLLSAYFLFVSEGFFITWDKIRQGIHSADASHGIGQTLQRYGYFLFPSRHWGVLFSYPLYFSLVEALRWNKHGLARLLLGLTLALYVVLPIAHPTSRIFGLTLLPLLLAALYAAVVLRPVTCPAAESPTPGMENAASRRLFVLLGCAFFVAALFYHSGSDVEIEHRLWESVSLPATGILCILLAVSPAWRPRMLCGAMLLLCCMSGLSLHRTIVDVQRNGGAMWDLNAPITLRTGTTPLLVTAERKAWVDWLRHSATEHDWQPGTPLLYVSVMTAGAIPLLEGALLGSSWPGDARYLRSLDQLAHAYKLADPGLLRQAWILRPVKEGKRHMPFALLPHLGLPFPEGYEHVGTSPATGTWPAEAYELWKPKKMDRSL